MTTREKLHRLVDGLADAELAPTLRIIEMQRHDSVIQAIANVPDGEAAVTERDAESAAGNTLSQEILRKYG